MNRIVKRGTTIYKKKPFVFALDKDHRFTRCDHCLKLISGELLMCSNCQYVYYCDSNCQKESWLMHRAECPHLKKALKWKYVPDMVRLMARIILKLNQGGADEVDYYTETNCRKFDDLMSHKSDIKKDTRRREHFNLLYPLLYEFLSETQMPNFEESMDIYGRICINAFPIFDFNLSNIASGIYLGPSVINHSCEPNTIITFEGTTIIVRTLEDLPCLDWSQITISYVDLLNSNKNRREQLHDLYYFWCDCNKCKESDCYAEAAACPNLLCDHPCSIDVEECEKCGTILSKEFKETFREVTDFTAQNLEKMWTDFDLGKICLKKQKHILHRCNVQYVRTLEALFSAAICFERWEDAVFYGEKLISRYLLYYRMIYPSVGLLYLMMGRIQLHLGESMLAFAYLSTACSVLKIIYDENHSVIREEIANLNQLEERERFISRNQ